MGRDRRIVTYSAQETMLAGEHFGSELHPNSVVCFFGDLGSGKTTFIKGLVSGVTGISTHEVVSPTFVYLNIYKNVYHFDLYRLNSCDEFIYSGFEEYLFAGGICCIEWSERIASILPDNVINIRINYLKRDSREILISKSEIHKNGR